jgi:hypothetical protein
MDTFPWPADADGKGGFLELKDINSDNSLATNWRSSKTPLSLDDMSLENQNLVLYPNPTNSKIYVNGFNTNIEYFEVLDIMGRTVLSGNSTNDGIDLTSLSNNTYIIKLVDENGNILVKKIIKY